MRIVVFAITLVATSACGLITGPYSIVGTIVARSESMNGAFSIHVKESPAEECGIFFTIRGGTDIWRRGGIHPIPALAAELVKERRVRVYWDGLVLTSCPGQASADGIELLPE